MPLKGSVWRLGTVAYIADNPRDREAVEYLLGGTHGLSAGACEAVFSGHRRPGTLVKLRFRTCFRRQARGPRRRSRLLPARGNRVNVLAHRTAHAARAGSSLKAAEQIGHQLPQTTSVLEAMATAQGARSERPQIKADGC